MFNSKLVLNVMASALVAISMTGCGSSGGDQIDPNSLGGDSGYTDPGTSYTDPTTGTGQYGGTTTPTTTTPTVPLSDLTATVTKKKNGSFLGIGTFTCTVEVSNPNSVARTGTLTVTFKNGKKDSKTAPITESINLGPNETKSFDYSDKKWTTDAVEANITTDAATTGGAATSYGAAGAAATTGSPYGTY